MKSITRLKLFTALLLCATLSGIAQAADPVDASDPYKLITTSSASMLKELDAHRADYRKDPKKVYALVDEVLLPHFDTSYAGQQVLGTAWRTATPEQRDRFVKTFYRSMLQSYGDALLDFTSDRMKILPFTGDANAARATVKSQVRRSNGTQVAVNYSLRKTAAGWKAWDVVIEGISYVKSFSEQFSSEINANGLDALIKRLEAEGVKSVPGT
ncbi:MAG: ABC transporter substrate-binding protein [Steroidobacteraceae bacterium]